MQLSEKPKYIPNPSGTYISWSLHRKHTRIRLCIGLIAMHMQHAANAQTHVRIADRAVLIQKDPTTFQAVKSAFPFTKANDTRRAYQFYNTDPNSIVHRIAHPPTAHGIGWFDLGPNATEQELVEMST